MGVLHLPASLGRHIAPDVACILPKSLTPEIGCTLRSLTHHLALVPGNGAVRPQWYLNTWPDGWAERISNGHALTLLLVPFPFAIASTDFVVARCACWRKGRVIWCSPVGGRVSRSPT